MIFLKSNREIGIIKANGKMVAEALRLIEAEIKPGVKTKELDDWAEEFFSRHKAQSAFKGYQGYPANICVSIDDEIVHGIPGERMLKEGQIVSIDLGVFKDGYYADAAASFLVDGIGKKPVELAKRLVEVTKEALQEGIKAARPGGYLSDISYAIQTHVEKNGFSVVRDLVGHGIGKNMHEDPQVPNFGPPGQGPVLKKGLVLAIEPMVNAGDYKTRTRPDNWTIVTADGSLSAHFEHTIAITEKGVEILTQ